MARKLITEKGFTVYYISREEHVKLIHISAFDVVCDGCGKIILGTNIVYVPVLNYRMCENCYKKWYEKSIYYKQDEYFSKQNSNWIECQFDMAGILLEYAN